MSFDPIGIEYAKKYANNIPDGEIIHGAKIMGVLRGESKGIDDDVQRLKAIIGDEFQRTKRKVAYNRYVNRICSCCANKRIPQNRLLECEDCHLTFWCNVVCKHRDKPRHKKWCLQREAIDTGPMAVVYIKL